MSPLGKSREEGGKKKKKKRLSGQYSNGEQFAREGNDLEDGAQICYTVKHGQAERKERLVEMKKVLDKKDLIRTTGKIKKGAPAINADSFIFVFSTFLNMTFF